MDTPNNATNPVAFDLQPCAEGISSPFSQTGEAGLPEVGGMDNTADQGACQTADAGANGSDATISTPSTVVMTILAADTEATQTAKRKKGKRQPKKPHKPKKDLAKPNHMAGHILMAYVCGVTIPTVNKRQIKKRPEHRRGACCGDFTCVKEAKAAPVIEDEVLVQLSGGLAEQLHRSGRRLTNNSTKRLSASAYAQEWARRRIAAHYNSGTDRFGSFPKHSKTIQAQVEYLTSLAQDILTSDAVRAAVQLIAKTLEDNETLDGTDAQRLLEQHFAAWQERATQDLAALQPGEKSANDKDGLEPEERQPNDNQPAAQLDLE
jgi:hypothetical protein